jgi:hypothetical protein
MQPIMAANPVLANEAPLTPATPTPTTTSGSMIFNLSTNGLSTGTYAVSFTAAGDPTVHTAQFQVK